MKLKYSLALKRDLRTYDYMMALYEAGKLKDDYVIIYLFEPSLMEEGA